MGVSVTESDPILWAIACLLSTFGIMSVLVALLYPHTKGRFSIALLAGALFATSHGLALEWDCQSRQSGYFLSLLGLLAYSNRKSHPRLQVLAILLCVLSAFVRQTMVAAGAAILLHSLIENHKQGLRLVGLYVGLGLLGLGGLLAVSGGQAWNHLITANMGCPRLGACAPLHFRALDPLSLAHAQCFAWRVGAPSAKGHPKLCCLCHPGQSHHCKGGLFSELFIGMVGSGLHAWGGWACFPIFGAGMEAAVLWRDLGAVISGRLAKCHSHALGKSQCRGFGSPIDAHWILDEFG